MVRLIRVGGRVWTVVKRNGEVIDLDEWPQIRVKYHTAEWLEWLGCEDVLAGVYSF
jgi:hypothetical protein